MKLKKKEDQSVDTSLLLRMGNKIPMEGVTETKFGAETKGWTIQRLPHPGIHPINQPPNPDTISYASKILLKRPWYSCLMWSYASAWQIQKWMLTVIIWMEHRAPNGGARESTQGAEGVCIPISGTTIWTNQYPQSSLAAYVAEDGLIGHHWEERPLVLQRSYASVQGNARDRKQERVGWKAGWGEGIRDFWDSIRNVNEKYLIKFFLKRWHR